ncbi:metal ABC transporter permease [Pseudorhodobacter ferrugineus]|uniref:metal ABC transporter permease n=1 Tax=Pseudorhodobacter ferrugineus TaxID=77008 RepID=UPI0003B4E87E|nr:metal ABC transporter permease [Pseudorhodobacter ferrugineus]
MGADFVVLSLVPILIGVLAAVSCALPGNFLLLRRQAMMGDMMAHSVLPGLIMGFLLTGQVSGWVMFAGAGVAALISALMVEAVVRLARVDPGAAMGMTFTTMFASGVLLLELTGASGVHLDVEHALYGNLESLIWLDAQGWSSLIDPVALAGLPPELAQLGVVLAVLSVLMWVFWRPLVMASFDAGHAAVLGLPVGGISLGVVAATAMASVAAFTAVGSILTIAMLICPPATARLLTNRLGVQVFLSIGVAVLSAVIGYVMAGFGPEWLGLSGAVSAAGMIAVTSGILLALAAVFGPHRKAG